MKTSPDRHQYVRYFDAGETYRPPGAPSAPPFSHESALDNRVAYLVSDQIESAVNVALAIGRPLLVRGEPGSGKTALARHVARYFGWGFEEVAVKSDTTVQDLAWQIDTLERLNDAYGNALKKKLAEAAPAAASERTTAKGAGADGSSVEPYIRRGPVWRAFTGESEPLPRSAPSSSGKPRRVVLLIDEIDKADPDVPNGLLDVLGNMQFKGPIRDQRVKAELLPFVVLTSNDERELPAAFLRRCVLLEIEIDFQGTRLLEIARAHDPELDQGLAEAIRGKLLDYRSRAGTALRRPSVAEFLDAAQACKQLRVGPGHPLWGAVLDLTLWKHPRVAGP